MGKSKFSIINIYNNHTLIRKNLPIKVMIVILSFFSSIFIAQINKDLLEKKDNNLFGLKNYKSKTPHSISPLKMPKRRIVYNLDNKRSNQLLISSLNSNNIKNAHSIEKQKMIDGINYDGELNISTRNNYIPTEISIKEIKRKYAKDPDLPCQYFFNDLLLLDTNEDYSVDENNILEINAFIFENKIENIKFNIIEIFSKSDANVRRAHEFIIR